MDWTFEHLRHNPAYSLGLGDIRLTIAMQDEVDAELARLRDLLRWRKWPEEKPGEGLFLVQTTCTDNNLGLGIWRSFPGNDIMWGSTVTHWRPIVGPEEER